MSTWWRDLRLGVRMLFKDPELTGVAVLALSLGIGLSTVMYSIVYGTLLRGLPFEDGEQLVRLESSKPASGIARMPVSFHDFADWRDSLAVGAGATGLKAFSGLAAWYGKSISVSDGIARPQRYNGAHVSAGAFELLGVEPLLGRSFEDSDDQPDAVPVVLISYQMWQERFAGDPRIVSRTLRADGENALIIGVMPAGFGFPLRQEIWMPLRLDRCLLPRGQGPPLEVFGRLRDGVELEQAGLQLAQMADDIACAHPATNQGVSALVEPYVATYTDPKLNNYLYLLLTAVLGVLLIACANVTNLLLARVALRTRDVAIRTSLGASRGQVITQLLSETLVLAACGGLLGLVLAKIGIDLYNRLTADRILPFWVDVRLDPQVFLFVLALTCAASLLSGIFPAIRASGTNTSEILQDLSAGPGSRRLGRFSKALVVAEFALSCGLLVATGLMVKSVVNFATLDHGFATQDVFTAQISLLKADYPDGDHQLRFLAELEKQLAALPETVAVAWTTALPGTRASTDNLELAGRPQAAQASTQWAVVSPGYFQVFGAEVQAGRGFTAADQRWTEPVVLVNQSFAAQHFPGESPLGQRLRLGRERGSWSTIVGVVPDLAMGGLDHKNPAGVYLPLAQNPRAWISLVLRTQGDPMAVAPAVRRQVASLDRHLPLFWEKSLARELADANWHYGVFGLVFTVFGLAALLLATIGLYGVMSLAASQRVQECGLRMALGARADDVERLILRSGLAQLGLGVLLGLGLAAGLARMLGALLFRVEPWDFTIFATVVITLVSTGLIACWIPAQRSARVDPLTALRSE